MGKKIKFQILQIFKIPLFLYQGPINRRVSWRTVAHEAWERGVPWTEPDYVDWEVLEWDEISDEEYERRK